MSAGLKFNAKGIASYGLDGDGVDMSGVLQKQGGARQELFQDRFFVLKGNILFYFKAESDYRNKKDPTGVIVLEDYAAEPLGLEAVRLRSLHVSGGQKEFVLQASTAELAAGWLNALRKASVEYLRAELAHLRAVIADQADNSDGFGAAEYSVAEYEANRKKTRPAMFPPKKAGKIAPAVAAKGKLPGKGGGDGASGGSKVAGVSPGGGKPSLGPKKLSSKFMEMLPGEMAKKGGTTPTSPAPEASLSPGPALPTTDTAAHHAPGKGHVVQHGQGHKREHRSGTHDFAARPAAEHTTKLAPDGGEAAATPDSPPAAAVALPTPVSASSNPMLPTITVPPASGAGPAGDCGEEEDTVNPADVQVQRRAPKGGLSAGDGKNNAYRTSVALFENVDAAPGLSVAGAATMKRGVKASFKVPVQIKCNVCTKTVYEMDKLVADGKPFHKTCLKCAQCKKTLSLGNYAALQGKIYCKPHFKQLFKLKGNYDEGFGKEQHKKKWIAGSGEAPQSPTAAETES